MVLASIGVCVDGSALPTITFIEFDDPAVFDHVEPSAGGIDHDVAALRRHVADAVEAGEHPRIELAAVRLHR